MKSLKDSNARAKRGEITKRVYLENLCQKMLQRKSLEIFLSKHWKQTTPFDLFSKYLVRKFFPEVIKISIIFTNDRNTSQVAEESDQHWLTWNHEEADTRVDLDACLKDANCVVVSKDTVVFVLMVFALALENIKRSWSMKIDHNKYINVGKVKKYLGDD